MIIKRKKKQIFISPYKARILKKKSYFPIHLTLAECWRKFSRILQYVYQKNVIWPAPPP